MQAIIVKYKSATSTRGSRLKAEAAMGDSISIPWDHSLSEDGNYDAAAIALCLSLDWHGELVAGSVNNGEDHVYVFTSGRRIKV
jgi:hypothetical protein